MALPSTRLLEERSLILTRTRDFFLGRGYLETDTPILAPSLIPESCLEVFSCEYRNPFLGSAELYLVPSPELWMKRVIAETGRSVFQVCKCFRNAESVGRVHNPEFTMLEYYGVGKTSQDNIALTEELFKACAQPGTEDSAKPPFRRMSMAQAFDELAGLDLERLQEPKAIGEAGRGLGLLIPERATWEDAFNAIFLSLVEPHLPSDRPLVLERYPRQIECLARGIEGTPWKDRWELYVRGVELANCYTEESEPEAVRACFTREAERKKAAAFPHRVDFDYPEIFRDFPPCSGVAMGFDRMVMALSGAASFDELLLFPFSSSIAPILVPLQKS